jgi:hypothetical protein
MVLAKARFQDQANQLMDACFQFFKMKIVWMSMFPNQAITGISRIYASNEPIMKHICIG